MPTGYTADVGDGKVTDFRTFALICARQFGACVMQRDDPMHDPPKLVEPSDYHLKRLAEAEAELARLQGMSVDQAGREADAEWATSVRRETERRNKNRATESRYRSMLAEVKKWTPPTSEHAELKRFMADQLRQSIDFDCKEYPSRNRHLTGEEWLAEKRGDAAHDIGYHKAEYKAECDRTAGRNAWIQALYDSLDGAL